MMGLLWENKITREEITKCLSGIILVCDLSGGWRCDTSRGTRAIT